MQYVDDDMDELFKKAAENYPLDTKGADWNKVLAALENKPETKPGKEGGKNRRFLWLLLLLPLGLICNQFYSPVSSSDQQATTDNLQENGSSVSITAKGRDNKKEYRPATDNEIRDNEAEKLPGTNKGELKTTEKSLNVFSPSVPTEKNSYLSKQRYSKANTNGFYAVSNKSFSYDKRGGQLVGGDDLLTANQFSSRNYTSSVDSKRRQLNEISTSVSRDLRPLFQFSDQESKQNIRLAKSKKFYAGLMGGIDATTVKFQKIETTGSGVGLLLGYQLNKKWCIESGAYLEKKYYYSDGKYLNTAKIGYLPPNTWIDDAIGNCKMIEIPVVVKYNFSIRRKSNWFGTLGSSSYIMQKEDYTYNYYYGTSGPVPHKKEYRNSSTNLFSALSVSAGYTHRLSNFGDVRIEPYLKLPVSGMGIGKLPFLSAGLQVGVTRKF